MRGERECPSCDGRGQFGVQTVDLGDGRTDDYGGEDCEACRGSGYVLCSECASKATVHDDRPGSVTRHCEDCHADARADAYLERRKARREAA